MERKVILHAHAKINLTLDVLGRLPGGYHEVRMVMQSVELADTVCVSIEEGRAGITLVCDNPALPVGQDNLAYRAAELFFAHTEVSMPACRIVLQKRIPVEAGLAGGSTDAAAMLHALNHLCGTALSPDALCTIGSALGADVPYCICGGTMLAEGIGQTLRPLSDLPSCFVVLCKPPFGVSTKEVYQAIDQVPDLPTSDWMGMERALGAHDYAGVCARLHNVLEKVTARMHPEITQIKQTLRECGAQGAQMSGSGPTVFGLFSDYAAAQGAVKRLQPIYPCTILTQAARGGAHFG